MARTQSPDYEQRRMAITERAAELFAARGFLGASIADIAKACDTSKSLLYHYYPSKEDILFDVMTSHVEALLEAAEAVAAGPEPADEKLHLLTQELMALYVGAAARHKVLLNELGQLPPDRRAIVVGIQRRLIEIVAKLISSIQPALSARSALRFPSAMLYFGMINWTHIWMDAEGRASPERIAELAVNLFLDGLTKAEIPKR